MRHAAAMLLALALITPAAAFDPPPPPPRPAARLIIAVPERPRPVWVEIDPAGLAIVDALAPEGNGYCAVTAEYAWCEVTGPAEIAVVYAPRAEGCAAGVGVRYDKRPAEWRPLAACRLYLPGVVH